MAAPEDQFGLMKLFLGVAAELFVRIPEHHLFERDAELRTGIAPEVLIRKKEHLVELFQIDVKQRDRI